MLPLLFFALAQAQQNPFNAAADIDAGGRLYRANCAICHGLDGSGGRGTNLTTGVYRRGSSDEDLFKSIANGVPGTEMPPFTLEGRQTFQLITFLRSLAERKDEPKTVGDAARGRVVFEGKGGCYACHMVKGKGSRLGPDLSDTGLRWSPGQLERAILRPDEQVAPRYWYAQALTRDGRKFYGVRLNEDTHSVQLLDSGENLVSLLKADLRGYEIIRRSTMPSYEGRLSRGEVNDLIAWLASLR